MSLLTERVEIDELGNGRAIQTIALKPIAVRENGSLMAMVQNFVDSGDGTTPHIVNRAPLRSRVANDGMRRLYPIPGDDASFLEIGAPFVKVGGVWTQVSLGTPSRSANMMTWTRPQTITRIAHGGHFVKLDIELRGGFVPEDSQVAFPVGLTGLTRNGATISKNGTAVMQLRPFVMEDAANLDDVRPISHQFVNINSQPYLLLTLPSLTGMTRPRLDPTLNLQPDATAGLDTRIISNQATTNAGTNNTLNVGESNAAAQIQRSLIKFDLSTLPSDATLNTNTFSMRLITDLATNTSTFSVYRQKRDWVEMEATWNIWKTSNNWSTAGGFHTNDCEQTAIGSRAMTATETTNVFKDWVLTPTTKAALDLGNGWLIKSETESDDMYAFDSSDVATAGNRPKLAIDYTEAAGGAPKHFMYYQGLRQ